MVGEFDDFLENRLLMAPSRRRTLESALGGTQSHRAQDIERRYRRIARSSQGERDLSRPSRYLVASDRDQNVQMTFLRIVNMNTARNDNRNWTFIHGCYTGDVFMESAMGRHGLCHTEDEQVITLLCLPCDSRFSRKHIAAQGHVHPPYSLGSRARCGTALPLAGRFDCRFRPCTPQVQDRRRYAARVGDQAGEVQSKFPIRAVVDGNEEALYIGDETFRFERFPREPSALLFVHWKPRQRPAQHWRHCQGG